MNTQIQALRGTALNIAVAKALGWICWNFHDGERFVLLEPRSEEWMPGIIASQSAVETDQLPRVVESPWPLAVDFEPIPNDDWAHRLQAATQLGTQYIWQTTQSPRTVEVAVFGLAVCTVLRQDFPTLEEAIATARCRAFLQVESRKAGAR